MRVLAINPFHGGAHAAFLDGWAAHSRHRIDPLTLPPRRWKWRLRHGALTLARRLADHPTPDLLWCTDMLDLAAFKAFAPPAIRDRPTVAYFHENQLTYPVRDGAGRRVDEPADLQPAFTNFTTALAADAVWFNSDFHRRSFLDALCRWLGSMPDHRPLAEVDAVAGKSAVQHPGVAPPDPRRRNDAACPRPQPRPPLHLVWAARWEHDKNPDLFFEALDELDRRGVGFIASVMGEVFAEQPPCFAAARRRLGDRVRRWGWQPDRRVYLESLAGADVFVSTADHEFFGLAAVEAAAEGCLCVLPRRLAYPEVFGASGAVWHDGTPAGIADALAPLAARKASGRTLRDDAAIDVSPYLWPTRAAAMDDALDRLAGASPRRPELPG